MGESGNPEATGNDDNTAEQNNQQETPDLPHSGAPQVEEPIDTTQFENNPCLALTDEQLDTAGYDYDDTESEITQHGDHICRWRIGPFPIL